MSRAGRKRKQGARERNGQRQRKRRAELVEERVRIARSQPHRRGLKSNDRASELAESALGRLTLAGAVSRSELAAGESFAAAVRGYRAVIEGPREVRSLMPLCAPERLGADGEDGGERFACPSGGADPLERRIGIGRLAVTTWLWPCQLPGARCQCAERRARYMGAYEAVAAAGRRALLAVIAVAVRGENTPASEIVYLRLGLRAAAHRFGLTDGG